VLLAVDLANPISDFILMVGFASLKYAGRIGFCATSNVPRKPGCLSPIQSLIRHFLRNCSVINSTLPGDGLRLRLALLKKTA